MTRLTATQQEEKERIRDELVAQGLSAEDATFAAGLKVGEHTGDLVLPDDWTEQQKRDFIFGTPESSLEAIVARDRDRSDNGSSL